MKKGYSNDSFSKEHPIVAKKIKKSLDISIKEGSMASASSGFGSAYLAPFALALGATNSQMGLLNALATFFPGIAQLFATKRIGKESRKATLITSVTMTILLWIPFVITGFLFLKGYHVVWVVIALFALFCLSWGYGVPAWFSWMGSLVPADHRGEYFSRRSRTTMITNVFAMVTAAIILDVAKRYNNIAGETTAYVIFAFTLLFLLAMTFRIVSIGFLKKQYEPHLIVRKKDGISFWQFLKSAPRTAFGRFTIFNLIFRIAVGVSAPFYVVYMLRDLSLSYFVYMLIIVAGLVSQIFFLKVHGKISDRFGNVSLARFSALFASLTPLVWFLSYFIPSSLYQVLYLIFVAQVIDGFGWAGYNLSINNYMYDSTKGAKREYVLSYMNVLIGVGAFVGASLGAWIALYKPAVLSIILIIFLISFVARFLTLLLMGKHLKEVRNVKRFDPNFVIHEINPVRATMHEFHHLQHLGDRVIHHI